MHLLPQYKHFVSFGERLAEALGMCFTRNVIIVNPWVWALNSLSVRRVASLL